MFVYNVIILLEIYFSSLFPNVRFF